MLKNEREIERKNFWAPLFPTSQMVSTHSLTHARVVSLFLLVYVCTCVCVSARPMCTKCAGCPFAINRIDRRHRQNAHGQTFSCVPSSSSSSCVQRNAGVFLLYFHSLPLSEQIFNSLVLGYPYRPKQFCATLKQI